MRIPFSRVWRAFPELDRFTDEQCDRFVRAACRGTRTRLVRWSLLALCCASLFATTLAAATYTHHAMWRHPRVVLSPSPVWHVLWGLLFVAAIALPPLATLLLRDVLLRRAIHATLRTRGICRQCRYSLVGLPVSEAHIVVCPECACESEVGPSLNELVHSVGAERSKGQRTRVDVRVMSMGKGSRLLLRGMREFDVLSDAQTSRFVRCVRRRHPRRLLHIALLIAVLFLLHLATSELLILVSELLDRRYYGWSARPSPLPAAVWVLALLGAVLAPPVTVLMLRDWLIRVRLRHLLSHRSKCPCCDYPLAGLTASDHGVVTCPECGLAYPGRPT